MPLSEEQKERMRQGRLAAKQKRDEKKAKKAETAAKKAADDQALLEEIRANIAATQAANPPGNPDIDDTPLPEIDPAAMIDDDEPSAAVNEPPRLDPTPQWADPFDGLLAPAELARIREEAQKEVEKELAAVDSAKKRKAMADALAAERQRLRRDAGLTDYRDDLLDILIDVAPFAGDIKIDGTIYTHGNWYKVDRRKYDSLREIMARSWDSEDRAGNPNRRFYRTVAGTMNPLAHDARLPDGTLTIGRDTRINAMTGSISAPPVLRSF